jgi:hypothetical protein
MNEEATPYKWEGIYYFKIYFLLKMGANFVSSRS